MSKSRPNRRNRLAYHEAGQTVAARMFAPLLQPPPDGMTAAEHFLRHVLPAVDDDPQARACLDAHVMIGLAGAVAEGIFAQCAPSECKSRPLDTGIPLQVLVSGMEPEEARRYVSWLERRLWNAMKKNWAPVDALAKTLMEGE